MNILKELINHLKVEFLTFIIFIIGFIKNKNSIIIISDVDEIPKINFLILLKE